MTKHKTLTAKTKHAPRPWLPLLFALPLAALLLIFASKHYRLLTALCCALGAWLLWRGRAALRERLSWPVILLAGYMLLAGVSALWAVSPGLFWEEYAKLLCAFAVFLAVLLLPKSREDMPASVPLLICAAAAALAALSVESASTGVTMRLAWRWLGLAGLDMGFESGTRLTGIFGSGNILAGITALGIFAGLAGADGARTAGERRVYAAALSLCAFAFLLSFSMGATAVFALCAVLWLICAGEARLRGLTLMLTTAVPTLIAVFAAFPCFNAGGVTGALPLLIMAASAAVSVGLDALMCRRAARPGEGKAAALTILGAAALAAAYLLLALNVTGGYTFGGELSRAAYPESGEYALSVRADGPVAVTITSQDRSEAMMHTSTTLYEGPADGADFTVPEGSLVCRFTFSAGDGVTMDGAELSDGTALPLRYRLLPAFIANRIQGLRANQNAIQRLVFFYDGLELFTRRALLGGGLGTFEAEFFSVQDFYYQTRYAHNHYIELLCDNGAAGLLLYGGALVFMLIRVIRAAKKSRGGARAASLLAALVMICGHAAVEVTLSFAAYLPFAFAIFGLVCLMDGGGAPGAAAPCVRWGALSLCGVYTALSLLSWAAGLIYSGAQTAREACAASESAARLDAFGRRGYELGYVNAAMYSGSAPLLSQAGIYADALAGKNRLGREGVLTRYYVFTGKYDDALREARFDTAARPMDEGVWRKLFGIYREFYAGEATDVRDENPFTGGAGPELRAAVLALKGDLDAHNAAAARSIDLGAELDEFLAALESE